MPRRDAAEHASPWAAAVALCLQMYDKPSRGLLGASDNPGVAFSTFATSDVTWPLVVPVDSAQGPNGSLSAAAVCPHLAPRAGIAPRARTDAMGADSDFLACLARGDAGSVADVAYQRTTRSTAATAGAISSPSPRATTARGGTGTRGTTAAAPSTRTRATASAPQASRAAAGSRTRARTSCSASRSASTRSAAPRRPPSTTPRRASRSRREKGANRSLAFGGPSRIEGLWTQRHTRRSATSETGSRERRGAATNDPGRCEGPEDAIGCSSITPLGARACRAAVAERVLGVASI